MSEIDELKARILELEEAVEEVAAKGSRMEACALADEVLNRTPAQSLEAHDREVAARALEELIERIHTDYAGATGTMEHLYGHGFVRAFILLQEEAAKLRAGGEKG